MPLRPRPDRACRRPRQGGRRTTAVPSTQDRQRQDLSQIARWFLRLRKPLLDLRRGRIGRALVVDPADFQIVALLAALEAELDIGILGHGRAPVGDEYAPAAMFEGQFLDKMRRNGLAL